MTFNVGERDWIPFQKKLHGLCLMRTLIDPSRLRRKGDGLINAMEIKESLMQDRTVYGIKMSKKFLSDGYKDNRVIV